MHFKCSRTSECFNSEQEAKKCEAGEDVSSGGCQRDEFKCFGGRCIPMHQVCWSKAVSANTIQNTFLNRSVMGHRTARNQTIAAATRVSSRSRVVTCTMTPLPTLLAKACMGSISLGKLGQKNQTGKNYWISSRCDGLAPGEPTICTNVSVLPKRGEAACRNCTKVRIRRDC